MNVRAFLGICLAMPAAVGVALIWATSAHPQERACAPLPVFERAMEGQYSEHLFAVGKAGKVLMRLYVDAGDRSWTILAVDARGMACLLAAGDAFDIAKPPAPGEPL